ncbi:MAG: hypothetical protein HQM09_22730 [Candidatus Riflebacteria bacterium]|nr:hypothetical protein [Candidatus Riflebacteria bacterium]
MYVVNVDFSILSATEIDAKSVEVALNQDIDPNSLGSANLSFDPPAPTVSNLTLSAPRKVLISFANYMADGVTYTITAGAGGLMTIDGIPLSTGGNTARFTADTKGPNLLRVGFEGISIPTDFIVYFDKVLAAATAQNISSYDLRSGGTTGSKLTLSRASIRPDGMSVSITAAKNLSDKVSYVLSAPGVTDLYSNRAPLIWTQPFNGIDVTPPVIALAVFANPVSASDLIVAASVSETLGEAPKLIVRQSQGSDMPVTMISGVAPLTYMAGVHLDPTLGGTGIVRLTVTDLAGNSNTVEKSFSTAMVSANLRAEIKSPDGHLNAVFAPGSVRANTFVMVIPQELELRADGPLGRKIPLASYIGRYTQDGKGSKKLAAVRSLDIASISASVQELEAVGGAWQISFQTGNLAHPYNLSVQQPESASTSTGIGVFRYDEGSGWTWLSSHKESGVWMAESDKPGLTALLRDRLAPRLNVVTAIDSEKAFTIDRPRFEGHVDEYGSGLANDALVAEIDGIEQSVTAMASSGNFVFIPLAPLTSGRHVLRFKATDRVGNIGLTPNISFAVKVPLAISEIMTYPNPARSHVTLRIGTNSPSLGGDMIEVKIYDVAGHRVRALDMVRPVAEAAVAARYLYDISWDLRNEDGGIVSNGVYFAKIEVRDPETGRTVKKTDKIAVLR